MTLTRRALLAFTAFILLAFAACSPASNSNTTNGNTTPGNANAAGRTIANVNTANTNAATQSKPGTGSIEIGSAPPGAGITLVPTSADSNGTPLAYGPTPATINDLAPGKYTVILSKNGYKNFQQEVEVKADSTVRVKALLRK
jgi:PEGA domain